MDIVEAVESVRLYKREIAASVDMASALHEIAAIRARKQDAWKKHDALIDKISSSRLVSGVYGSTGAVQNKGNRFTVQEMIEECSDLTKAIRTDNDLLYDAIELIEGLIGAIPDRDTRTIIEKKYPSGWSDTEIAGLFGESTPGYVQRLEQRFFQSLR